MQDNAGQRRTPCSTRCPKLPGTSMCSVGQRRTVEYFSRFAICVKEGQMRDRCLVARISQIGTDDVRKLRYFEDFMFIHEELHLESISIQ